MEKLKQDNPEIINQSAINNMFVFSYIFYNPNLNFIYAIRMAQMGKILGTAINLGSSSNGGSKGGSNFGGFRRR